MRFNAASAMRRLARSWLAQREREAFADIVGGAKREREAAMRGVGDSVEQRLFVTKDHYIVRPLATGRNRYDSSSLSHGLGGGGGGGGGGRGGGEGGGGGRLSAGRDRLESSASQTSQSSHTAGQGAKEQQQHAQGNFSASFGTSRYRDSSQNIHSSHYGYQDMQGGGQGYRDSYRDSRLSQDEDFPFDFFQSFDTDNPLSASALSSLSHQRSTAVPALLLRGLVRHRRQEARRTRGEEEEARKVRRALAAAEVESGAWGGDADEWEAGGENGGTGHGDHRGNGGSGAQETSAGGKASVDAVESGGAARGATLTSLFPYDVVGHEKLSSVGRWHDRHHISFDRMQVTISNDISPSGFVLPLVDFHINHSNATVTSTTSLRQELRMEVSLYIYAEEERRRVACTTYHGWRLREERAPHPTSYHIQCGDSHVH